MQITVLGSGCANCHAVERAAHEAVEALGLDASVELVTDPAVIAGYGILRTPGLVVDDEVVSSGRVPTAAQVQEMLAARR